MDSRRHKVTHRDVGLSLCAVESELQGFVPVEEGKETLGPKRGNEISEPQPPVEAEDSVDVQSQTAAVVHQDAQLLPLENRHAGEIELCTTLILPLELTITKIHFMITRSIKNV